MSEPFISEIKIVGFNFAPRNWALCDGQILPINQNQSLYSLLGTTFGGDGRTSFALPDLRGRSAMHFGTDPGGVLPYRLGQKGGAESVTLNTSHLPAHNHPLNALAGTADESEVKDSRPARTEVSQYADSGAVVAMGNDSLGASGAGRAHENMQPYLAITFVIALTGVFPSRN